MANKQPPAVITQTRPPMPKPKLKVFILMAIAAFIGLFLLVYWQNYLEIKSQIKVEQETRKEETFVPSDFLELQFSKTAAGINLQQASPIQAHRPAPLAKPSKGFQILVTEKNRVVYETFVVEGAPLNVIIPTMPDTTILVREIPGSAVLLELAANEIIKTNIPQPLPSAITRIAAQALSQTIKEIANFLNPQPQTLIQPPAGQAEPQERLVKIENEITKGVPRQTGDWPIHSTDSYKIEYAFSNQIFFVTITKAPFEENKQAAQDWFKTSDLSDQDLCQMRITFLTTRDIKEKLTETDIQPSGC